MTTPKKSGGAKQKRAYAEIKSKNRPTAAAFRAGAARLDALKDLTHEEKKPVTIDLLSDSESSDEEYIPLPPSTSAKTPSAENTRRSPPGHQ